jgi:hypothetical protein
VLLALGKKKKKEKKEKLSVKFLILKKNKNDAEFASKRGRYLPTYLPTCFFNFNFITVLLVTYLASCTDLPGRNASVCLSVWLAGSRSLSVSWYLPIKSYRPA